MLQARLERVVVGDCRTRQEGEALEAGRPKGGANVVDNLPLCGRERLVLVIRRTGWGIRRNIRRVAQLQTKCLVDRLPSRSVIWCLLTVPT